MSHYAKQLRQVVLTSAVVFRNLSEEDISLKHSETKWSKKEILGHLIDSCNVNHVRIAQAQSRDNLVFDGYDQDLWVKLNGYQERKSYEVLNTWICVNHHLSLLVEKISAGQMARSHDNHNFHEIAMNPIQKAKKHSFLI